MPSNDFFRSLTAAARLSGFARKQAAFLVKPVSLAMLFTAALAGQALTITTTSLPTGTVNVQYGGGAVALAAKGGVPPYVWSLVTGPLPPGLSLSSAGLILGTPSTGGAYPITVSVTDSSNVTVSKQFTVQIAGPGGGSTPSITTTSPLPAANVGQSYSQTLSATGGTSPYTWSGGQGLPAGLTLGGTGAITGTPTTAGSYSFSVVATDSKGVASAAATLALTVNPSTLQITTPGGALFNGTAASAYSTTFSAQGGTPPYTWSVPPGTTDGLTFMNPTNGVLSGTPTASGTFSFVVQVADSATPKATATQSYSLVVNNPSLIITASSFPSGTVGVPYNQTSPAAVVSGGTAPYTWSLSSGSVPGLSFVPASVALSGTPSAPGTFPLTLQVSDAAGLTASKSFSVTIAPAGLSITTSRQLSSGILNIAYSQSMAAAGGAPPYTWSANGLPKGLTINSNTGQISGIPTAAGTFSFVVITVIDSALKTAQDNFTLIINLPPTPPITISGLPATSGPTSQFPLQVTLGAAYSTDITGQLTIGFQANTGLGDSTIQFSTGGKTANFTITAGTTSATFVDAKNIPVSQLQIQTGTVAGTISVSLSNVNAAGVDITPSPAPSVTTQIATASPVIVPNGVLVTLNGSGGCPSGQICIQVTGYSTAREVTQAVYTFSAASGQTLQPSAASITVDVSSLFTTWFGSSTIGSQFILNQPFTVQGDPTAVIPLSVTLANRQGTTTFTISH